MHWLFRVPELLSIIFRHLKMEIKQRSLRRVARCCRSFHDASSAILWEDLHSLIPLLHLFPSDAVTLIKKGRCYQVVSMSTNIPREYQ
jgi:hypothetical protein